jgi:spermidine/putrescine transport system ATP-binding protein
VSDDASTARGDLKLSNITKSYGDFTAVDDLSLVIPKGSFFALLGPSGCGKTTTLRMIAGLEEPTQGKISLGPTDITDTRPYQRPINTVFQNYALFPHLTIFENIAFGLRRRGIKDVNDAVDKALDLVELPHLAQRKPTQLSGGQQQRTFVHVTHDQEEAMTMADTIAVMNEGQIEQMGSPAELYDNPKTAFVANFLGQSNLIKGTVTGSDGSSQIVDLFGQKISLQKDRSHAVDNSIYAGIRPEKFRISRLETATAGNVLTGGKVEDVSYIGVSTQYQVMMPWGQELMVFEQNDDGVAPFSVGESVNISWEPVFTFGLRGDEDAEAGTEVSPDEDLDEE